MTEREQISSKARSFFDELWQRGDPWDFETSDFEHQRFAQLLKNSSRVDTAACWKSVAVPAASRAALLRSPIR